MYLPKHLSLFLLDKTGKPLANVPVYAEVRTAAESLARDQRFDEQITNLLSEADPSLASDGLGLANTVLAFSGNVAALLTKTARDRLATDADLAKRFFSGVIHGVFAALGVTSLKNVPRTALLDAIKAQIPIVARQLELDLAPTLHFGSSFPLGFLASDHVGYLSFDLSRLPDDLYKALIQAMQQRALQPDASTRTSARFAIYGRDDLIFDALEQCRFADDAIVTKLELNSTELASLVAPSGYPSLQLPSLTDWRLSPASFASSPSALVGNEPGCESILPANSALQEYSFYQVTALSDSVEIVPSALSESVQVGVIHDFKISWYPLGHSLGAIQYSLPLAPGESINLAVVDWTRRDNALRKENTNIDEQIVHQEHRDRVVSETVNAAVKEYQAGSSFLGGLASSAGASGTLGGFGLAAGLAGSLGGSTSNSSGTRDLIATTVQNLSDSISQASAASRELNSTVVVHSNQAEKEAIETRTIVNYNHSHALTILYYEVLRHFRVVTGCVRRRPAVLLKMKTDWFDGADAIQTVRERRVPLKAALLDPSLADAFDAVERIARSKQVPAPPTTPSPGVDIRYFVFDLRCGGLIPKDGIGISATLRPKNLQLNNGVDFNPPGLFSQKDANNSFVGQLPSGTASVPWADIDLVSTIIKFENADDDDSIIAFSRIKVTGIDTGGNEIVLVDKDYADGHLILGSNASIDLPTKRPPAPPPMPARPESEIQDEALQALLLDHLRFHKLHYSRAILISENSSERALWLSAVGVLERVENRPVEIIGDYLAFPCTDLDWSTRIERALHNVPFGEIADERLVTVPARGVFAEAKLGHCNSSEVIDNTRFWDWQQSPIPHFAPEIGRATPVTPHPVQPEGLTPSPFPQSLVNIVNPPPAPDPTGLAAAMSVLGTPNLFRDMSGQVAVADLLKRLSDNSISIAQAANIARQIQSKYGDSASGGTIASNLLGQTHAAGGIGGPRATPVQPSQTTRDLHDWQDVLRRAQKEGLLNPAQTQAAYQELTKSALDLQQVGDTYVRPAWTKNQLIGLVGEVLMARALERDGLILFTDVTKHVATPGIDLVALDARSATLEVWLIDNKAQMRGISGASSLTTNFNQNRDAVLTWLETECRHSRALEAAQLIRNNQFRKVVSNAWAGSDKTFTKRLFDAGLHAYDLRLGQVFTSYATWETAFGQIQKGVRRVVGLAGSATLEGTFLIFAAASGILYVMRSDSIMKTLGNLALESALGAILSELPGGFFGSMVLDLESDESPGQRLARKKRETIDEICSQIPDFSLMSPSEQTRTRDVIGEMLEKPLDIPPPPEPSKPKYILPGFPSPSSPIEA
ncbi:hypothetical protein WI560_19200 [Bradyrhizobium sp. A11]|uniref:hypothetical protein n=1 Tax=Bradyrhizobium sp. A11 TaxID=3133974 RepID=UPI00324DA7BE